MTVEKMPGGFTGYLVICDECDADEYIAVDWDSPFSEVLLELKSLGYKSFKNKNGEWKHLCRSCWSEKE